MIKKGISRYDYADDELLYISPGKQGAGRADIQSVIQSGAYLCTENNGMPKASIGDGMNGKYNFSFFVRNVSQETQIFSFNHFIATDKYEVTDNKIINTILDAIDFPLIAPSANISDRPSGIRAQDIAEDFKDTVDIIIDGGDAKLGTSSTIVKVVNGEIQILRAGEITKEEILAKIAD